MVFGHAAQHTCALHLSAMSRAREFVMKRVILKPAPLKIVIVMATVVASVFGIRAAAGFAQASAGAQAPRAKGVAASKDSKGSYNPKDLEVIRPIPEAMRPTIARVLKGSIDTHLHLAPADATRPRDAIEAAKEAKALGMRAILITSHYEPTASVAYLVRQAVPGIEVFGSLSFELETGGINVAAVEQLAKVRGAYGRVIEFPTFAAEWRVRESKDPNGPFVAVSRNGDLVPEVKKAIAAIAKNNLVLSTGHATPEEALMLIREARKQGVQRMVLGHNAELTIEQLQEATKLGALIEYPKVNELPIEKYAERIRKVGPEYGVLSEIGLSIYPPELIGAFPAALLGLGFTEQELDTMMRRNPAKVLGLPPLP
jgi:hypothetical protein